MPRIEPATEPLSPIIQERVSRLLPPGMRVPGLFRTVARNERLFAFLVDSRALGPTGLFDLRQIPAALREAIILRTCACLGNDYEFSLHVQTISRSMGLSEQQISALRDRDGIPGSFDAATCAALTMVDSLTKRGDLTDDEFRVVSRHHGDAAILEMVFLVGIYTMVALMVAVARPEVDSLRSVDAA